MNMKYVFTIAIALASVSAFAVISDAGSSDAETSVTWNLDEDTGVLTISGTGAMDDYDPGDAPWDSQKDLITSVIIEDGVTSIGRATFYYCQSLRTVTIGSGVESIGDEAFENCTVLESITVSASNTKYSSDSGVLFNKDMTELIMYPKMKADPSYTVPSTVTKICDSAFSGCLYLGSVDLGSCQILGNDAFQYCTYLSSVDLGSVETIGNYVFEYCYSLKTIEIPDTVRSIDQNAFHMCTALSSATIGKNVQVIGTSMFYGCIFLSSISVDPDNTFFRVTDNMLIDVGEKKLIAYPAADPRTTVTIPDSVTAIGNFAFYGCANLTSVTVPDSVTVIGEGAFVSCSSLTEVTIPDSVTSVGIDVFWGCKSLASVEYSKAEDGVLFSDDGTTLLSYPAGSDKRAYKIPDGVTTIASYAFRGADSLVSIEIPASVTCIEDNAFDFCTSIQFFLVDDGNTKYCSDDSGSGALFEKDSPGNPVELIAYPAGNEAKSYTIPDTVESVESTAFRGCRYLESITVPDSVTELGSFSYCTALKTVHFGSSVEYYDGFLYCTALESVTVDANNTFYRSVDGVLYTEDLSCLEVLPAAKTGTFEIPAETKSFNVDALSGGNSITAFTVAAGNTRCTAVDGVLFSKSLKTLVAYPGAREGEYVVPDGTEYIEMYAFAVCGKLTSLTIPDSVVSVNGSVIQAELTMYGLDFPGCSSLEKIVIGDGLRFVDLYSFEGLSFYVGDTKIPASSAELSGRTFVKDDQGRFVAPGETDDSDDGNDSFDVLIVVAIVIVIAAIGAGAFLVKKKGLI